ncbi:hypothetical protein BDQ17DRAFT_529119 [Cyathus striatus]|nr:hypothetical protein BDQ17DRAFT_529119 [Cyathus striatus]
MPPRSAVAYWSCAHWLGVIAVDGEALGKPGILCWSCCGKCTTQIRLGNTTEEGKFAYGCVRLSMALCSVHGNPSAFTRRFIEEPFTCILTRGSIFIAPHAIVISMCAHRCSPFPENCSFPSNYNVHGVWALVT